jgi:hypothetical protein
VQSSSCRPCISPDVNFAGTAFKLPFERVGSSDRWLCLLNLLEQRQGMRNRRVPPARSHQQRDRHSHEHQSEYSQGVPSIGNGKNEGFHAFRNCWQDCRIGAKIFGGGPPANRGWYRKPSPRTFGGVIRNLRAKGNPHSINPPDRSRTQSRPREKSRLRSVKHEKEHHHAEAAKSINQ